MLTCSKNEHCDVQCVMIVLSGSVTMREKVVSESDENQEIQEYHKDMEWLTQCKKGFYDWYDKSSKASKEEKKVCNFTHVSHIQSNRKKARS